MSEGPHLEHKSLLQRKIEEILEWEKKMTKLTDVKIILLTSLNSFLWIVLQSKITQYKCWILSFHKGEEENSVPLRELWGTALLAAQGSIS